MASVLFKREHADAKLPVPAEIGKNVGYDLCCVESVYLVPGKPTAVRTGVSVELPPGCYGRIAPRSGHALRSGVDVLAGVIDPSYRGELIAILIHHRPLTIGDLWRIITFREPVGVSIDKGKAVAQFVFEVCDLPEPGWARTLSQTARGAAGFGSTDAQPAPVP
jgi:dUTP pyrophosphatase